MRHEARRAGRFNWRRGLVIGAGLLLAAGCAEDDRTGPSAAPGATAEPAGITAAATSLPGIVFSSASLTLAQINSVQTGTVQVVTPSSVLSYLSGLRAKKGRVLIKFAGENSYKNPDGSFNITAWKSAIDRFRSVNLDSYINDGTIVGHYLVDEPHFSGRWGGKVIPQATIEEIAKYSKQRWPNLPTLVNAPATWLASAPVTYVYLDAAWAMFRSKTSSSPSGWIANQVNRAKSKKLGLVAGLNVLDGGNGSSGIRGTQPKTWAMSAAEVNAYGSALLGQSYVCAFSMWRYSSTYYNRADMKNAMSALSTKARNHAGTSCRQ